ncbi:LysM peptidoglycan-binding domain-containing protein [uncultured Tessaracoccus sp.]|uniref:LysM peptidoglycan-binding domain-containing protein n=1 Tax=uncultured Tessaracoccus sp. TaxID=905023 RepID=UPI00260AD9C4|nr:LysM peptidoglycan-binding domain-containing protein [uncultured Tessaracoccus sp.]
MKWLRAAASLALLVGVLVGVPMLLFASTNPSGLLEVDWARALMRPDDGRIVLELLGLIGWLAWGVLAATIIVEVVAVVTRRRIDVRLPGTQWLRPAVTALVAAVLLAPVGAASAAPPDTPAPHATAHVPQGDPSAASSRDTSPDDAPPAATTRTGREYVVQPGDELWTLAKQQLGSGERWRDILAVNPGLTAEARLRPGTTLQVPPDVQVARGDSLWKLAARHLGDGERWPEIHELNADLILNPDEIDIGWRLLLPTTTPAREVQEEPTIPEAESAQAAPVSPESSSPVTTTPATSAPTTSASPPPAPVATQPAPSAPTSAAPSSEAQPAAGTTADDASQGTESVSELDEESHGLVGAIGGMLASTIVVGVAARRRLQLVGRALGRRLVPLSPEATKFWTALARKAETSTEAPTDVEPTSVVLGWRSDESEVTLDLEQAGATGLIGAAEPQAVIGAMATSLLCAPWSSDVEVVLVGADQPWAKAVDDPRLRELSVDEACEYLTTVCATRRLELGARLLDDVRACPDLAPAWHPVVALFAESVTASQARTIEDALGLGRTGVSAVIPDWQGTTQVQFDDDMASLDGERFRPQLLTTPARRALVELFAGTLEDATEPAGWWSPAAPRRSLTGHFLGPEPEPSLPPAPSLVLLGEPALEGATGQEPRRAQQQCIEYAAWLLLHPGSTATTMSRALCVAEGTRRSNLSRLRTWLGCDEAGHRFLPEAYQGRISLDERVTSDWHRVRALIPGTINEASDRALRYALTLVSGPPLGTAVVRWPWARTIHDDMVAFLVDVACELTDRCLAGGYFDEALWALEQGRNVGPNHDELRIRAVRARHLMGDAAATRAEVASLIQTIRDENRQMQPEHAAELARIGAA